ncbi:hypothetical protein JR316_0010217 [Psilocybe cubensis]|uniref:Uncharacterized protein n=2 Tax=Psilocybe cubensis TaxID=181762 RepID=A0A8H7XS99_PSICU|nr:hypothetical protein JR316_0010217 [Psilocybe cubensis]KAH9477984.1 hypothetical protein JR316_0010217 [Psilocybe cubensis]
MQTEFDFSYLDAEVQRAELVAAEKECEELMQSLLPSKSKKQPLRKAAPPKGLSAQDQERLHDAQEKVKRLRETYETRFDGPRGKKVKREQVNVQMEEIPALNTTKGDSLGNAIVLDQQDMIDPILQNSPVTHFAAAALPDPSLASGSPVSALLSASISALKLPAVELPTSISTAQTLSTTLSAPNFAPTGETSSNDSMDPRPSSTSSPAANSPISTPADSAAAFPSSGVHNSTSTAPDHGSRMMEIDTDTSNPMEAPCSNVMINGNSQKHNVVETTSDKNTGNVNDDAIMTVPTTSVDDAETQSNRLEDHNKEAMELFKDTDLQDLDKIVTGSKELNISERKTKKMRDLKAIPVSDNREHQTAMMSLISPPLSGSLPPLQKQITAELEQISQFLASVNCKTAELEADICSPKQRTMDEIRGALQAIDSNHDICQKATARMGELQAAIIQHERAYREQQNRKPLEDRRKVLRKERTLVSNSLKTATSQNLADIQEKLRTIEQELSSIRDQLNTRKRPEKSAHQPTGSVPDVLVPKIPSVAEGEDSLSGAFGEDGIAGDFRKAMEAYTRMTGAELQALSDGAQNSIQEFLETGKLPSLKVKHRKALRMLQFMHPELCITHRQVALGIHMTSHLNLVCRYHERSSMVKKCDNETHIAGVAYRADYSAAPQEGHMNCGCLIDDVLLDFYFWKTLSIRSTNPKLQSVEETMKTDVFPPRIRAFVIKLFTSATMLTASDIYNDHRPRGKFSRETHLMMVSFTRLGEELKARLKGIKVVTYGIDDVNDTMQIDTA